MIGYVCILLIIVGGGLIFPNLNTIKKSRKLYMILVFGLVLLYAVLRGESVGIDNASRYATVRMIAGFDWDSFVQYLSNQNDEQGYSIVIWIITRIIPSPHFIGVLWDVFIILTFAFFFYRYSEDLVLSNLMYAAFVFSAEMNTTRQYIAAAIFLWVIIAILNKRYILSFVLILISMTFHSSALVLFIIYALIPLKYQMTKTSFVITICGAFMGFFAFDIIANMFVSYFPQYSWYLRGSWAVGDQSFSVLWLGIYSILALLAMICLPGRSKNLKTETVLIKERYKMQSVVAFFYVIYATASLLTSKVWFVSRINVYFIFAYCMVIPMVFNELPFFTKRSVRMLRGAFMLGLVTWAIMMFRQNSHGILPYEFFWE